MQYLEKRVSNHQYYIRIKDNKHSALCDHVINTEHVVNWEDVEVLHRESNQKNRDVMEMIYIKTTPNTINKQIECKYLSNTYNHILQLVPSTQMTSDSDTLSQRYNNCNDTTTVIFSLTNSILINLFKCLLFLFLNLF